MAGWRAARDRAGKLEFLLLHLKNLGLNHSTTALDERIASMRTKRHLSGTSVKNEVSRIVKTEEGISEKCWRDTRILKTVNAVSIRNVRKDLRLLRKDLVMKRERALESFT